MKIDFLCVLCGKCFIFSLRLRAKLSLLSERAFDMRQEILCIHEADQP